MGTKLPRKVVQKMSIVGGRLNWLTFAQESECGSGASRYALR